MKKIVPIIFILTLMACGNKINTNGGSWVFHSNTYKAIQAYPLLGGFAAYTGTDDPSGSLALWFCDSTGMGPTWPPHHHTYTLCRSYPPDSGGQVFMQLTDTSIRNSWVITGNKIVYVTVDTALNGFRTVTIPPVEVINVNDTIDPLNPLVLIHVGKPSGTDSSLMSGTIIQTR